MSDMSKRPSENSMSIKEAACLEILPEVMEWLNAPFEKEEVLKDLAHAAEDDAYKFARNLERNSWDCDFRLVEILAEYSTHDPYMEAVAQWVKDNNITIPYAIGDEVDTSHGRGAIVAIRPETAELIVQPVVPDGRNYGKTGGWVIRVENATSPA